MTHMPARILSPLLLSAALFAGCGSSSSSSSSAPAAGANTSSNAAASTVSSSSSGSSGAYSSGPYSSGSGTTGGTSAQSAKPVVLTTKHSKFGTILAAGTGHMTVYLFEADKGSQSSCTGECAKAWPPVLGSAKAVGAAMSSDLGTIKRAGGTTQITYKGHPLYYFIKDKDDGDAYGQGIKAFGASWYVLAPSGKKVDES